MNFAMQFRRFRNCERGNFMILTALMAGPLLILFAGVLESNRSMALHQKMQAAADAAVMAAFYQRGATWQERQDFARKHFLANLGQIGTDSPVRGRLDIHKTDDRVQLTFRGHAHVPGMFTASNPFAAEEIRVRSVAELERERGSRPRLVTDNTIRSNRAFTD